MPRQVGRPHFLSCFDWKAWPQFVGEFIFYTQLWLEGVAPVCGGIYILYSALTGRRGHISLLWMGWVGGGGGVRVNRFLRIVSLGLYHVNNLLASIRPIRIGKVPRSLTTFLCFMFCFMSVHNKVCALAIMLSVFHFMSVHNKLCAMAIMLFVVCYRAWRRGTLYFYMIDQLTVDCMIDQLTVDCMTDQLTVDCKQTVT